MDAFSLLLLVSLAAAADAPVDEFTPPPGTVGLLTPPLSTQASTGCVQPVPGRALAVHAVPRADGEVRGEVRFVPPPGECMAALPHFFAAGDAQGVPIPQRESSYEEVALVVLEARPPWFRLALHADDSGWVHTPDDHRYDAVWTLLVNGLDHFTGAWPGQLCARPGQGCSSFDDSGENTVRVLESRTVGEAEWWKLEVTTPACADADPRPLRTGWVPARGADGRPTVWFYSRGC